MPERVGNSVRFLVFMGYRSTFTWDSRFSRLWQRVIFCFLQLVMKMVAVPSIEYNTQCHNPEYQNIDVNLLPFPKTCYVNISVQLDVVHCFWKHDSLTRNQPYVLSTVRPLRSNILMFRTGVTVFLFLLLAVAYPGILFGGGSTNSVEDRGQRERGSGVGSPLVRGSGGSCNLIQEISFHIVKFS